MQHSSSSEAALAGATSGLVSRMLVSPLDVLKIRWQQNHSSTITLQSSLRTLLARHGTAGLFRGNSYGIAIWVAYGAVQFPAYEHIKHVLHPMSSTTTSPTALTNFAAGSLAAAMATVLTFPLDAVRTRLITADGPASTAKLSRGLHAGLLAIVPMSGLTFCLHELLMPVLGQHAWLSGLVAGMLAKTCFYPLDTVKRRLMTQGLVHAETGAVLPSYASQLDCVRQIYAREGGARAFFKGLMPATVKTGLGSSCTFFVYELCVRTMRSREVGETTTREEPI